MSLFTEQINNWDDWGKVFQSIPAFTPLIKHIFQKENLPLYEIENLTPGTNAVFKVGVYVIKIFMPSIEGNSYGTIFDVELFGMKLANSQGVNSPKLFAYGAVEDKYLFKYMIMDYIQGHMLDKIENSLSYEDKVIIGQNIRKITEKLNVPCENFTPFEMLQYAIETGNWKDNGFPSSFLTERLAYLKNLHFEESEKVYCHGDFHCGNVLVDEKLNVYIVDFADAMYAPAEYELIYIVSALFCFEKPYMEGYFGNYLVEDILNLCMTWLPIHVWGHSTIEGNIKPVEEITSFEVMRQRLYDLIKREKEKTY